MNTFGNTKNKRIDPRNILGGIPGLFNETDFERETPAISTIAQGMGGVFETISSLVQDITGIEPNKESDGVAKFPSTGSIEFNNKNQVQAEQVQKDKAETDRKKAFYQALKEDQERAQRAKDKLLFEEEINDIVTNLPTEQKNALLHYQASYRDRSIYQRAELRTKLIEQRKEAEKQEKQVSIPSPAKQPSALEGAFEGRSGSQGGGTANLSAHATG